MSTHPFNDEHNHNRNHYLNEQLRRLWLEYYTWRLRIQNMEPPPRGPKVILAEALKLLWPHISAQVRRHTKAPFRCTWNRYNAHPAALPQEQRCLVSAAVCGLSTAFGSCRAQTTVSKSETPFLSHFLLNTEVAMKRERNERAGLPPRAGPSVAAIWRAYNELLQAQRNLPSLLDVFNRARNQNEKVTLEHVICVLGRTFGLPDEEGEEGSTSGEVVQKLATQPAAECLAYELMFCGTVPKERVIAVLVLNALLVESRNSWEYITQAIMTRRCDTWPVIHRHYRLERYTPQYWPAVVDIVIPPLMNSGSTTRTEDMNRLQQNFFKCRARMRRDYSRGMGSRVNA